MLGLAAEGAGDARAAREHWLEAATEMQFEGSVCQAYAMLAWLALGRPIQAFEIAHHLEQIARGEKHADAWLRWLRGEGTFQLNHGLAQLAKGHVDQARRMWTQALAEHPDGRWIRLHADMPRGILERMCRKT
jgi:hypothetical protein